MIEQLILSRFRGIRKGVIKDMGKINLLVGPNNSGKTAVLEALYWLSVSGRACGLKIDTLPVPGDEYGLSPDSRDAFIPIRKDMLGCPPCPRIWVRHGKSNSWHEAPGYMLGDGSARFEIPHLDEEDPLKEFRLTPPQAGDVKDTKRFENVKVMPEKIGVFVLDNPEGLADVLKHYLPDLYPDEFSSDENVHRRFAVTWFEEFIHWKKSLGVWGVEGKPADADCVLFFDFHATGDHFTKVFWNTLRDVHDWRDHLTHSLSKVIDTGGSSVDIEPHPTNDVMQGAIEIKGKGTIAIDDFGDGARHAFKVLAGLVVLADRCKGGREGLFLWEDPELFMHSKSLYRLIGEVMEIVKNKPIQVFISTQSLDVLACMAKIMEDEICGEDDVRTYRLSLNDGVLDVNEFWGGALNDWLHSGFDPRLLDVSEDDNALVWHLEDRNGEEELLW